MDFANNNILLILISLAFIYAVLSILVSILTEWWNSYSKERGIFLKDAIYKLLKDPLNKDYGYLFYNHVTIAGLKSAKDKNPQYISSRMFAEVLIDVIAQQAIHERKVQVVIGPEGAKQYQIDSTEIPADILKRFQLGINNMNTSQFSDLMQSFLDKSLNDKSELDYSKLKTHIEQWFNDYMDRVSGWYKTKQRKKFLFVGFVVAISLNVDSLHLIKVLSLDDNLRNRLVASAEQTADNLKKDSLARNNLSLILKSVEIVRSSKDTANNSDDSIKRVKISNLIKSIDSSNLEAKRNLYQLDSAINLVSELNIPIGWSSATAPLSWLKCNKTKTATDSLSKPQAGSKSGLVAYLKNRNSTSGGGNFWRYLIGIIISGVSLSFGAPFWFEILVKFVNIRRSGKVPEENKK
ncbi:hypothetical protein [Fluviicola taffensis]|uniref:hypothetical protein n=1 Tax=Fluviicola taffensis TaxID=191579 RepID=UPI00313812E1